MVEQPTNIKAAAWLAGPAGRIGRIVVGALLILVGLVTGGVGGIIIGLVGLLPIGLGVTNRCLISRVIGAPWKGEDAIDMVNA